MLSQIPEDDYLDMFDDDDDSDSGSSDSHDDDISIVVKSSDSRTTQKKIFRKKKTNDEDLVTDFDKEMESELWDTVNALECVRKFKGYRNVPKTEVSSATTSQQKSDGVSVSGEGDPSSSSSVIKNEKTSEQYDDIYFDSDEELEKTYTDDKDKHPVLSNEDLFYDPDMDTKDQLWMDERRRNPHMFEYLSPQKRKNDMFKKKIETNNDESNASSSDNTKRKKKPNKLNKRRAAPKSDAILDCPACMTTLCIDCQKHATFVNQYRAMFVMNCTIDFSERFRYSNQSTGKKKKRQVSFNDDDMSSSIPLKDVDEKDDLYYSVKCDECGTKVAMYDKDEVYHFFNVISSYG